jgi:hypothetical protein
MECYVPSKDWIKAIHFYFAVFQDVISQGFLAECQVPLSRDPTGLEKYALKQTSVKNMVSIFKKPSMPFVI